MLLITSKVKYSLWVLVKTKTVGYKFDPSHTTVSRFTVLDLTSLKVMTLLRHLGQKTSCLEVICEVIMLLANTLGKLLQDIASYHVWLFFFLSSLSYLVVGFIFYFFASQSLAPLLVSAVGGLTSWVTDSVFKLSRHLPVWAVALKKKEESRRHRSWLVTVWHQLTFKEDSRLLRRRGSAFPPSFMYLLFKSAQRSHLILILCNSVSSW